MTQFLTTPIDKSLSTTETWLEIDLSGDIPIHATGAIILVHNTDASWRKFGIQKNGSGDNHYGEMYALSQGYHIVGVDANRKIEGKIEALSVNFYLIGYTEEDATLFTNGIDKSIAPLNTWTTMDISANLPVGTVAAIFKIKNNATVDKKWSMRKYGGGDEFYSDIGRERGNTYIVGVDSNRKCEGKIESTQVDFYLMGYFTKGAAETNGIDHSLGTVDTLTDITESNAPSGATGAWVHYSTGEITKKYLAIKKGAIENFYLPPDSENTMLMVPLDANSKWQGKIEDLANDWYTKGYFAARYTEITKTSSIGLSVKGTLTKASSIGLNIHGPTTKASSIGLSVQETFTKASSIGLRIVSKKAKASSIGLSVYGTPTKASSVGLSVVFRETKVSSVGLRVVSQDTKASSIGLSVYGTPTKASSIGLKVISRETKASSIGLRVISQKAKASSIGLGVYGTIEKPSSIGLSVRETLTKASSIGLRVVLQKTKTSLIGLSVQETFTKASSVGLRVVSKKAKASSIGLSIHGTPEKPSSIGLRVVYQETKASSIGLQVIEQAIEKSFYYAKLGSTILEGVLPESFRITKELNRLPSFDLEIANSANNRAAISANIDSILDIRRISHATDSSLFSGIINADGIEYISLDRIRITGFEEYVKLAWPFFKHLNTDDAEACNKILNFSGSYTDYTIEANNTTTNDVLLTFGDVNHAFYIGENNPFWGAQLKYSTKGAQNANTAVVIEYSKGSSVWGTLDALDETNAFTEDAGTYDLIIAHPPSDWKRNTVDGVKKYWIRYRVTTGSYSTAPKLDQIHIVNVDVYRIYYFDTSAREILLDVLEETEYTMDSTDQCPEDIISVVAEYESPLRVIAAIPNALTWTDTDGTKKEYQWWIDSSKKVHIKNRRGTTYPDDITGDLSVLNNLEDYFHLSNRLHGLGPRDGLSQMRAIVEDTGSQTAHSLREIAVPLTQMGGYVTLKERLQKNIAISKGPMQRIRGSMLTELWKERDYEVGDTILLHQEEWNVSNAEFQIVKVEIGPLMTTLNLGISQEYLDGLKANMQRQLDLQNIQMHGSTTLLEMGPETMNYDRISATEVYSAKLNVEIPSATTKMHKVLLSWTPGKYRAAVGEATAEGGGQASGYVGAGGSVLGGNVGAGGGRDSGYVGAGGSVLGGNVGAGGGRPSGYVGLGGGRDSGYVGAGGSVLGGNVGAGGGRPSGYVGLGGGRDSGYVGAGGSVLGGNVGAGGGRDSGYVGAGGSVLGGNVGLGGAQSSGYVGAGGAITPIVEDDGSYLPTMLGKAHSHSLETPVTLSYTGYEVERLLSLNTGYESMHTHVRGSTGGPDDTADAVIDITPGSDCASGSCVASFEHSSFAEASHYHLNTGMSTGSGSSHRHSLDTEGLNLVGAGITAWLTTSTSNNDSPAHLHTMNGLPDHGHLGVEEPAHNDHTYPAIPDHSDHTYPPIPDHDDHLMPIVPDHSDHTYPPIPDHDDHLMPVVPDHDDHLMPIVPDHSDHTYPPIPDHDDHLMPVVPDHDDHLMPIVPDHSDHTYPPIPDHDDHLMPIVPDHSDHTYPPIPDHDDHLMPAVPDFTLDTVFTITEFEGSNIFELLVNEEKIGEYTGPQTDVRIDGYLTTGNNTIEIQPIVTELLKKGSVTISGNGILFVEPTRF